MERVITYVDGFNLYFGLKDKRWDRYLWLNIQDLSRSLLKPYQQLVRTKYFTARVSSPPGKQKRQAIYIEALETLNDFGMFYGKYLLSSRKCPQCGYQYDVPSEKMTDVNIAVGLMDDAFYDRFDTAMIISADSDLVGPVKAVRRLFPMKRVVVAFPPARHSQDLANAANASFTIGRGKISKSLFPLQVTKPNGVILTCPAKWQAQVLRSTPSPS